MVTGAPSPYLRRSWSCDPCDYAQDQDMSEADKSEETNPSTSMSYILQRVKRIREMLKISFLKKRDSDDQLPFKGIPTLLHTGHSEKDE
jgi:hypothetical protein